MSVDLPTPGSPPSRTSAPGTTPPPRTRSNSSMPVGMRATSVPEISWKGTGTESHEPGPSPVATVIRSSTRAFHCWQDGHRPIHFGEVWPHCWQTYCVLGFNEQILETSKFAQECQFHDSGGPVTLLSNNEFGKTGVFF